MKYSTEYMRKRRAGEKTARENGLSHLIEKLAWEPVSEYPGYLAAKEGYILSEERVLTRKNGRNHTVPARVLKACKDSNGYAQVRLYLNGKKKDLSLHRLIYKTYSGEIPDTMVIDHIDGDITNNNIDNLQILSNQKNVLKGWEDAKKRAYTQGYAQAMKDFIAGQNIKV